MQIANWECKFGNFIMKNYAIIKSSVVIKRNLLKWCITVDTKCKNFEMRNWYVTFMCWKRKRERKKKVSLLLLYNGWIMNISTTKMST